MDKSRQNHLVFHPHVFCVFWGGGGGRGARVLNVLSNSFKVWHNSGPTAIILGPPTNAQECFQPVVPLKFVSCGGSFLVFITIDQKPLGRESKDQGDRKIDRWSIHLWINEFVRPNRGLYYPIIWGLIWATKRIPIKQQTQWKVIGFFLNSDVFPFKRMVEFEARTHYKPWILFSHGFCDVTKNSKYL